MVKELGGHFKYQKHRKRELNILKEQNFINWTLVIATLLTAIIPFIVPFAFPSKTIINYPERGVRQDIHIDSVWLHQQVDYILQQKISNPNKGQNIKRSK